MESIPVQLHTPDSVITETFGLLGLQEGRLVLEFETKDSILGAYKSSVEELEMLPDDVSAIEYKKRMVKGEIRIHARSMKLFEKVPGAKLGTLRLIVKRKDRLQAQELVDYLQGRLEELQLQGSDTPTPVPELEGQEEGSGDWN